MIQNPFYIMYQIGHSAYLFPTAHDRLLNKPKIRLNMIGQFLWQLFETDFAIENAKELAIRHFKPEPAELLLLNRQVEQFTEYLVHAHLLVPVDEAIAMTANFQSKTQTLWREPNGTCLKNNPSKKCIFISDCKDSLSGSADVNPCYCKITPSPASIDLIQETVSFTIAGIVCSLTAPASLIPSELSSFQVPGQSLATQIPQLSFRVLLHHEQEPSPFTTAGTEPAFCKGAPLFSTPEIDYFTDSTCDTIVHRCIPKLLRTHLFHDGRVCIICDSQILNCPDYVNTQKPILHAMRYAFSHMAEEENKLAVHSSSVIYRNKIYLFSASSGTGKTTHTNLWHNYLGAEIANGDLNLCGFQDNIPSVFGIPWCGTSNKYITETLPLGGIIFLHRDQTNHVKRLSHEEACIKLSDRLLTTAFTKSSLLRILKLTDQLLSDTVYTASLFCNTEKEAFEVMKQSIDLFGTTP